MARTVIANDYGASDVLSIIDIPDPEPGEGHVLLSVKAIGVNFYDIKRQQGAMGKDPHQLPLHFGLEAAGVIIAINGDAVGPLGPLNLGDEVCVNPASNTYTDLLVVDAASCLPKPELLSWEQSGGLLFAGATAYHALLASGARKNDTLLIHGAAGGIGHMVVQLAVAQDIRVIGTAGESQHDLLHELGAQPVVYGDGLTDRVGALASHGVDAVVDTVGTDEAIDVSLALTNDASRIASIAAFHRAADGITLLGGMTKEETAIRAEGRKEVIRLANEGKLTVRIEQTFPLEHVRDAHTLAATGHAHGKIVLVP